MKKENVREYSGNHIPVPCLTGSLKLDGGEHEAQIGHFKGIEAVERRGDSVLRIT